MEEVRKTTEPEARAERWNAELLQPEREGR